MKSFLFASILLGILSGFSTEASGQFRRHKKKERKEQQTQAVFITDISITPGNSGSPVAAVKSGNQDSKLVSLHITADAATPNYQSFQFKYGQLLNRDVETITNAPLFRFIEEWWATPYQYGGSTHKGIDCSAFSSALFSAVYGIQLPRTARNQYHNCEKIDEDNLMEGDLVFFNTRGGVSHVGVSLGGKYFVHASTASGVIISSLDENYYSRRFIGGGRIATSAYAHNSTSVSR